MKIGLIKYGLWTMGTLAACSSATSAERGQEVGQNSLAVAGNEVGGADAACATPPPACVPVGPPQVFAWGDNAFAQVAPIATPTPGAMVPVPTPVNGLPANIVALAAGDSHSLALDDHGNVWAWGANGCGELGVAPYDVATDTSCFWDESPPRAASPYQPTPTMVPNLPRPVTAIAAGFMFSVALLDDGSVMTWGYNLSGSLGTGHNNYVANPTPQLVMVNGAPLMGVKSIHVGEGHVLAVTDAGVWGWGDNYHGELAVDDLGYAVDGPNGPYPVPPTLLSHIPVGSPGVTAGWLHTYFLEGGALMGFGSYYNPGGTNFGDLTSSRLPMQILGPSQLGTSKIREIGSGGYYGIALADDGQVWFWGDAEANTSGEVPGPGPTTIQGLPGDVTDVWAGYLTSFARDAAGQIWSWGWDDEGELGVATPPSNDVPVRIPTITGVTAFSATADFALALGYACTHVSSIGTATGQ